MSSPTLATTPSIVKLSPEALDPHSDLTKAEEDEMRRKSFPHPTHPYLFGLMTFCSMAELGLTAFLISAGNEHHSWSTVRYHALLILFCFDAVWTMIFSTAYLLWYIDGSVHVLASIASSVIWLAITSIVWGTASGVMHSTRGGTECVETPNLPRCRQNLTVEALGWTEFSLCVVALLATLFWIRASRRRFVSDSRRAV
ncbi:hypothetical protein JAAARDRAFT_29758 [Jaapia argillacea MUCL 33604]|uniref:MARVEL domain-containing protein n=1 Tax=Jaapia argillacea MUCL 33604 TaxID=933084 RepID=A0A067Q9J8_9AGAM|nr:hypothetical protein JAAARDRAFT_29758 [Jaapia argillacea MUCL 33604]